MIKKLYRHIAKRYKYWRYRRLMRKLFWFYAQKTNYASQAIEETSEAFTWFTGVCPEKDDNWIWYCFYLDSRASSKVGR